MPARSAGKPKKAKPKAKPRASAVTKRRGRPSKAASASGTAKKVKASTGPKRPRGRPRKGEEGPQPFACEVCGKKYGSYVGLYMHKKKHHIGIVQKRGKKGKK